MEINSNLFSSYSYVRHDPECFLYFTNLDSPEIAGLPWAPSKKLPSRFPGRYSLTRLDDVRFSKPEEFIAPFIAPYEGNLFHTSSSLTRSIPFAPASSPCMFDSTRILMDAR